MKKLNAHIENLVKNDYSLVLSKMDAILQGKRPNSQVRNPDYLEPTVLYGDFPLDDSQGEFVYYSKIRTALEDALTKGKISSDKFSNLLIRAP